MTTEQKTRLETAKAGLASLLNKSKNGLPYKPITEIANRDTIRENTTKRGRETYYFDFKLLKIRDGFNLRKEYLEIPQLADSIEVNGMSEPLVVDMLPDGTCYIEQGHRRYKALQVLKERKVFSSLDLPGVRLGSVECFVNPREVDELTRIKRQYTSNSGEKYTPLELGELCCRLFKYFNMTQVEIATELGMSRQNVKNMMIINEEPDDIKQAIKSKHITPTAAIELSRKIKDSSKRRDIVQEAVKSGKAVSNNDVKRIVGDKEEAPLPDDEPVWKTGNQPPLDATEFVKNRSANISTPHEFDESRAEIQLCNNVIKNIDKLNRIVVKIDGNLQSDMERLLDYMHKDMEAIRMYVHKNKKQ